MNETVDAISLKVFGIKPTAVFPILGKGEINNVFKAVIKNDSYIFRIQNASALKTYVKEKWCIEKVSAVGVPTSTVIDVGICNDKAYSIFKYIEGVDGTEKPEDKERIWYTLGQYAKKINSVKVKGYGEDLKNPDDDDFVNEWKGVIDWSLEWLFETNFFIKESILNQSQVECITKRISELYNWQFDPVLCHSNLAPKNTVIDPAGRVYLIDWGTAGAHRAPHLELSEVLTWGYGEKYENAFMKGYGISKAHYELIKHDVEILVILRLVDSIKWGITNKKNGKELDFVKYAIKRIQELVPVAVSG